MRLIHTDLVPVLAIIAGGMIGVLSSSFLLSIRSDSVRSNSAVTFAPILDVPAPPPLVYIDGVRVTNDPGTPSLEEWRRGERAFTAAAVRAALTEWLALTGTSPLLIDGVDRIEVLSGDVAVDRFGKEASGGVVLVSLRREAPEPAAAMELDISAGPTSPPYTVAPRILNVEEVRRAMFASFPPSLRYGSAGGTASIQFFIDEHGEVRDTRIGRSSGHDAVDEAALVVADVIRFSPALDGDSAVPVWISHELTFTMR